MDADEYKRIADLLDRFFEGRTSNEEERALYAFFSRTDVPAEWERYKALFAYFENGIASEIEAAREAGRAPGDSRGGRIVWWSVAVGVAASLLLLVGLLLFERESSDFDPYEGSYIVRNGQVIVDMERIRPEIEAAYRKAEAAERAAERMLGEGDCLDRQIRAAEKRVERIHTSLLEGVGDDRLRTEVRRLLESGR